MIKCWDCDGDGYVFRIGIWGDEVKEDCMTCDATGQLADNYWDLRMGLTRQKLNAEYQTFLDEADER